MSLQQKPRVGGVWREVHAGCAYVRGTWLAWVGLVAGLVVFKKVACVNVRRSEGVHNFTKANHLQHNPEPFLISYLS